MQQDMEPRSGWSIAFEALRVRLRFLLAIAVLAALAALWPWLTNVSERAIAWLSTQAGETSVAADTEYFCPMDPGVVSAWPAICPICKMDLITRKKTDAEILPSGVVSRMQLSPYRISLSGVRTVAVEAVESEGDAAAAELRVPVSSVVRRGDETLVYVESMPGMLDGVLVELGERDGDTYRVRKGLREGQRVVALGTLLVDAESRLNPNLSTQYFGASLQTAAATESAPPIRLAAKAAPAKVGLDPADQKLVDRQRYCPVTEAELGSMGTPIFVDVDGRKIAICCAGCREPLLAEPKKYLSWLDEKLASEKQPAGEQPASGKKHSAREHHPASEHRASEEPPRPQPAK